VQTDRRVPLPHHCKEFWDQLNGKPHMTRLVTRFRGSLNLPMWQRAVGRLLSRHPILNARVVCGAAGLEFVLSPDCNVPMTTIDFAPSSLGNHEAELAALVASLLRAPFDAQEGRLCCTFAIRVSDAEYVLGVICHHLIADTWSLEIIGRELLAAYAAEVTGKTCQLPEQYIQYLDYIQQMNEWLLSEESRSQAAYWRDQLAHPPAVYLPVRREFDADDLTQVTFETFQLERAVIRAVGTRAGTCGITPFIVLLAASFAALAAVIGSHDIAISISALQRGNIRLRNTVGCLVNHLPVRCTVDLEQPFADLLTRVRQSYLHAHDNQLHPYTIAERRAHAFPTFRFRRVPAQHGGPVQGRAGFSRFDLPLPLPLKTTARRATASLRLEMEQAGDSMRGHVYYLPTLYSQKTVVRLVHTLCAAIDMAADVSGRAMSSLLRETE
jgi:hypothetical protein